MIRVVNCRGLNSPEKRAGVCYCGRPFAGWNGHPLKNTFKPGRDGTLAECLAKYREWLLARPRLETDLAALWEQTQHGELPLGCWCVEAAAGDGSPLVCHAQILAEMLRERFCSGGAAAGPVPT